MYAQWDTFKKISFLSLMLFISACDSFVAVELPKSQLTAKTVFQDYSTANAALASVYAKIRDNSLLSGNSSGLSNSLGLYADELTLYGSINQVFYNNTVLPTNTVLPIFWNNSYNQIYAANAILEGVQQSWFSSQQKAQLSGEVLFLRGLLHFYLLQLFGDIPYIRTTDFTVNSAVSRLPEKQVYSLIIADLNQAAALLLPTYSSADRVRPNSFAAKALLARVQLYDNGWGQAEKMATELIAGSPLFSFENNLNKVFLNNSSETIWQFMPSVAGKNTDEGAGFYFVSSPPNNVALSESLMGSFAPNDLRKASWTAPVTNAAGKTWYYAFKYKESKPTSPSKEYSIVLRLTEQYLIRAEARANQENLIGAREDLNKIRNRAGLMDVVANTKQQLLDAILEERRKELFTEHGHRFFDLRRMGKLDAVLSVKPAWKSTCRLLPVPESELIVNPNLKPQNPGY